MILTTERLLLREFEDRDWPAVLTYQSDPLYLRYYHWTERTAADVRAFVHLFVTQQQEQPRTRYQLAIVLKEQDELIGNCGIRQKSADAWEAEIGFELDSRYWGRGYATEAARAMLAFGFTDLAVHRVSSWCIAENAGSARVLQKIGMRPEGRLRENEWMKGRWWDTLLFAILDHEWQDQTYPPSGRKE